MAFLELGDRDDVEQAIRKLLLIPIAVICAFVMAGVLKDYVSPIVGFVLGGAVGGLVGFLLGEGIIRLSRVIWPSE